MFIVTADEKVQREQTQRVHKFAEAMIELLYWDSPALKAAYVRIEELEARNRELRLELDTLKAKVQEPVAPQAEP